MILLGFIFVILCFGTKLRNSQIWAILVFICLAILVGFRGLGTGTDTITYYDIYNTIGQDGYRGYPEFLFGLSALFCNKIGLDFWQFNFLLMLIAFFSIWRAITKWSPNIAFSIFVLYGLYFVMYALNTTRQIVAISILLYAYSCMIERNYYKFSLLVFLASGFHYSSILGFSALLINRFNCHKKKTYYFLTFLSLIIGVIMPVNLLIMLAGGYGNNLGQSEYNAFRSSGRLIMAFFLSSFWSSLLIVCISKLKRSELSNIWIKLFAVGILVNNLCMRTELGLRIVWIFSITSVIAYPIFVKYSYKYNHKKIKYIISLYITIFFFTLLLTNSASVWPYTNELLNFTI